MGKEGEVQPDTRLVAIHLDLQRFVLELESVDHRRARFSFAPEGTLFDAPATAEAAPPLPIELEEPEPTLPAEAIPSPVTEVSVHVPEILRQQAPLPTEPSSEQPQPTSQEQAEKEPTVTLKGRLKTQPVRGKPDRSGRPTAWSMLAVHQDDQDEARLYSTTFHRHTAKIALSLPKDSPVVVEGYIHERQPGRGKKLDSLSVVVLHNYPGKPERGRRGTRRTP